MAKTVFSNVNRREAEFIPSKEQTTDPSRLIDIKIKQLRSDFEGRAHRLKTSGIAVDAHNRILAGWQKEYDRAKGSLTDDKSRLKLASRMVRTGEMLPETARDVGRHTMGLPSAPRAGAERQPSATGMSPGVQASYFKRFTGMNIEEGGMTDEAKSWYTDDPVDPRWWRFDPKTVSPKKIKDTYFRQRKIGNFSDPYNAAKLPGFNWAFENAMAQDPDIWEAFETLKKDNPKIKAAFAPQSDLGRVMDKKLNGKSVSPLGRSIASGLPKQPQQAPQPIRQWSKSRGQTRVSHDGGRTWQIE